MEEFNLGTERQSKGKKVAIWLSVAGVALFLICVIVCVVVLSSDDKVEGKFTYLTYSNYQKIENGMTYEEVVQIFEGHEGILDTSSSFGDFSITSYTWENEIGTRYVSVVFENNKVYSKSQFGLR